MADRDYAAELAAVEAAPPEPTYADRLGLYRYQQPYFATSIGAGMNAPPYPTPDEPGLFTHAVIDPIRSLAGHVQQADDAMWGRYPMDVEDQYALGGELAGAVSPGALLGAPVKGGLGMGIRAYHGSPHDFDRFSMDKIGTGEGAQAYGHGLYFAENEGVANSYKKALGGGRNEITDPSTGARKALDYDQWHDTLPDILAQIDPKVGVFGMRWIKDAMVEAAQHGGSPLEAFDRAAAAHIQRMIDQRQPENIIRFERASAERARAAMERLDPKPVNVGSMYEVSINASPDEFLDWDKPLSEQPAKVREALARSGYASPEAWEPGEAPNVLNRVGPRGIEGTVRRAVRIDKPEWKATYDTLDGTGTQWFPTEAEAKAWIDSHAPIEGGRGAEVYQQMRKGEQSDAAITEALRNAGIKGIRYKDAGSRGGEGGTYNYVVFSDDVISILKKYGLAGLTAGGAGAAMLGGSDPASAAQPTYRTGGRF